MTVSHDAYWFTEPIVLNGGRLLERAGRDEFFDFCAANRKIRIERTADAKIVILPPSGFIDSNRILSLVAQICNWSDRDGTGIALGGLAGYWLPNGAMRSPRASWILRERWLALPKEERDKLPEMAPDFVMEIRSEYDRLAELRDKMQEYADNGVRLGWLIDPVDRRVEIYRPGQELMVFEIPAEVSGDPELPGFKLDLKQVWSSDG